MTLESGKGKATAGDEGYLSDESDFYGSPSAQGDASTKSHFNARAAAFSPVEYWTHHEPTLTEQADANAAIKASTLKESTELHNPYAGQPCAWQLGETIPEFLQRLPPDTTLRSDSIPWIYVANPFRKARGAIAANEEAPPGEGSRWSEFVERATTLLNNLRRIRHEIEKANEGEAASTITRIFNKEKENIVQEILDTAIETRCTTGKWMLFVPPTTLPETWSRIATATSTNSLGVAAKVAPRDPYSTSTSRLICIYTEDFSNIPDVIRVLKALKELGVVEGSGKQGIYYKCDAYTYLGLNFQNEHNIKASLYNSIDLLKKPTSPPLSTKPAPSTTTTTINPKPKPSSKGIGTGIGGSKSRGVKRER
ncbi:dna polymerase ii large subunit protein [Rutstroemia sp. NJR-2017a WRK4]|nr:dna polymerase ii large subunit protein [Rutstroemia sp. NJR-2017a WRK4]